jgi:hypothetical protein
MSKRDKRDEFAEALAPDSDLDSRTSSKAQSNGHAGGKTEEELKLQRSGSQRHARSESTRDSSELGTDEGWTARLRGMKSKDFIPPLLVLTLLLSLSYVLDPIWGAYLTAQDWTGPILPVFLFEFLFGIGAEIADWCGAIDLPQRERQRLKAALILTGTLGTVAAFIVNPDAPFGVALHSTALGVGSGLVYHFYQMCRGLRGGV